MLEEGREHDKEKTFVNHYGSFITRTQQCMEVRTKEREEEIRQADMYS